MADALQYKFITNQIRWRYGTEQGGSPWNPPPASASVFALRKLVKLKKCIDKMSIHFNNLEF